MKLVKSRSDKMISGVCSGIANTLNIDKTIVRLIWVLTVIFGFGTGILIYIVCAIVMPNDDDL